MNTQKNLQHTTVAPDPDSDNEEPHHRPPVREHLPKYIAPNADDDFLKGKWGFIHVAIDLCGCDLNAFSGEEWRDHIAG